MECSISKTEPKTVREDRGKPPLADSALCLLESIRRTMERHCPRGKVDHRVCGAGVPVPRLTNASRVEKRAGRKRVGRAVGKAAGLLFLAGAIQRWDMRVPCAAVRRP